MGLSDDTEKIPSDTHGIDPWTFRLVWYCLNHYATPVPLIVNRGFYTLAKATGISASHMPSSSAEVYSSTPPNDFTACRGTCLHSNILAEFLDYHV
jgi:hypothetical protein